MKTSKSQQEQTKRDILRAAVDLITEHGFDQTSMKQIARAAGIGDATIYKYFPTKEKLLLGYYDLCIAIAIEQTSETPSFADYTLQERLQRLVDSLLELFLADREFVAISRAIVSKSPLLVLGDKLPGKLAIKTLVLDFLQTAEDNNEIPPCEFKNMIAGFFGDYVFAVVGYWLNDESEEFSDTTQLVDLTLAILALTLKSGVINKLAELISFLIRNQLSRLMQNGSGLLDILKLAKQGLSK